MNEVMSLDELRRLCEAGLRADEILVIAAGKARKGEEVEEVDDVE